MTTPAGHYPTTTQMMELGHCMFNLSEIDDHQLLAEYEMARIARDLYTNAVGRIEQTILARTKVNNAEALVDAEYDCPIASTANYDRTRLTPLLEVLNGADLAKCYEPAHQETVDVEAKWDLVKLKPLARKYGGQAAEVMAHATLEPSRRVGKFKRLEVEP